MHSTAHSPVNNSRGRGRHNMIVLVTGQHESGSRGRGVLRQVGIALRGVGISNCWASCWPDQSVSWLRNAYFVLLPLRTCPRGVGIKGKWTHDSSPPAQGVQWAGRTVTWQASCRRGRELGARGQFQANGQLSESARHTRHRHVSIYLLDVALGHQHSVQWGAKRRVIGQ